MAVAAVAFLVIQKITDTLTQESIMHQKVMVDQLKRIKKDIERMKDYFLKNEYEQKTDVDKYLRHFYDVEDAIETYALRFARQRKRLGFLTNRTLFFKNFAACRNVSGKIIWLRKESKKLNRNLHREVEDASVNSKLTISTVRSISSSYDDEMMNGTVADQNQIEEEEQHNNRDIPHGLEDASVNSTLRIGTARAANSNDDEFLNGSVSHPNRIEEEDQHDLDIPHGVEDASVKSTLPIATTSAAAYSNDDEIMNGTFSHQNEMEEEARDVGTKLTVRTISEASVVADRLQSRLMYSYSYDEEELDIVGFKKDVPGLVRKLTEGSNLVVSIVGHKGSGKTTLARAVYGNRKIKEYFKSCAAWATICKDCNATVDLLRKLLKQLGDSKLDKDGPVTDEQKLKTRLFEWLKDKQYLIILDDFESSKLWDDLQTAFPIQGNRSKIVLITCDKAVATHASSQLHILEKLSDEDSWNLFLRKAGLKEGLEDLKQRTLEVCSCLPLNIILLGSLLSTKEERQSEWQKFLSSQANRGSLEGIIALSYNDLPVHLKLCLLYTVLFPKEFDIPVRRLQRLWLAEGFVERPHKSSSSETFFQEDVAKQYFDNLVKRSLIQVSKLTSDGWPKKCRVLGVLYDHLVSKTKVISLFHVHQKSDSCEVAGPFGVRRLVQYTDMKKWDPSQLKRLRSYLSFNIQYRDTPAKEVGSLLQDMIGNGLRLLRVLDLEGVYKPSLPENLGDFCNLRYLGLRWTFLDALPESVGQLHYLEALDIKHTFINSLPTFIWKLKHLKHLNANGIRLDLPSRHLCSSLPQLLTLWGFSVDDDTLLKDGLNSLVHLRELGITFHLSNSDGLLDWISNLTALETLRLRSNDMGRPSKLILKSLSSLKQLTHLNLLGNLPKLPEYGDFPQELKVLTLSASQLNDDPMPTLGKLPKLTVLRLLANSYLEKEMVCPQGGFKELRVLKLWMLKNLEQWAVKEGAMERLKELNIRCCDKLRMIPERLLRQRTFKELTLTNMPEEFRKQVEKTKFSRVSLTIKNYKFSPLPWEGADDSLDGEIPC
ncbi:hypothetical protein ACH5RR_002876 [Cinchona calisaya]|uniref:AAA+ ATPase domain-containing protein n=1 Tax=Cinchona calisaya TaxID=153742 RepID=A0ABD3AT70_9GENT